MTDSHQLIEAWLAEGATGDPPRELAVHATVCASCARRIGSFDALAAVDVGAAGSPPPLAAPGMFWILLARGRVAAAVAGTVLAGILVVVGASQLVGFIGDPSAPGPSQVAAVSSQDQADGQTDGNGHGPQPAEVPTPADEPPGDPIAPSIPIPPTAPGEPPPAPPNAPYLSPNGVGYFTVGIRWSPSASGGPVFKWELWRRIESGAWLKLGELPASVRSFINGGLTPGTTYGYLVRAVNVSGTSGYSNSVTATTLVIPTAEPTPSPTASPTESPTATPDPTATPEPDCNDTVDNDGDGFTDWPADPGCSSSTDLSESPFNGDCNDDVDNDGDGFVDFPADPGCSSSTDLSESPFNGACNDDRDNDGDGFIDFPADPGCDSFLDDNEFNAPTPPPTPTPDPPTPPPPTPDPPTPPPPTPEPPLPQCSDLQDNDGDTLFDLVDPGCSGPFDDDESDL